MGEFFGFGEMTTEPAGAYSWQHLTFVTSLVLVMTALAIMIGLYYRKHPEKNNSVAVTAVESIYKTFLQFR